MSGWGSNPQSFTTTAVHPTPRPPSKTFTMRIKNDFIFFRVDGFRERASLIRRIVCLLSRCFPTMKWMTSHLHTISSALLVGNFLSLCDSSDNVNISILNPLLLSLPLSLSLVRMYWNKTAVSINNGAAKMVTHVNTLELLLLRFRFPREHQ